jgi:hypothetical protein
MKETKARERIIYIYIVNTTSVLSLFAIIVLNTQACFIIIMKFLDVNE